MVRKNRKKASRPKNRRTTRPRPASGAVSGRRARAAIEVRRAPLEPEVPVDPDAPLAALARRTRR
jgi:hypothetical protein